MALLVALFAGCGTPERPPHGLSDSLFVEALVAVHLADARASTTGEDGDSLRAEALDRYGLDTLALRDALDFYAAHPEPYLAHYDAALDRLLQLQRGPAASSDTL